MGDPSSVDVPASSIPTSQNARDLDWIALARRRPGMYIASTDRMGLLRLACGLVDNSVDEFLQGHASQIEITIDPGGVMMVRDNGRGISVARNAETGTPFLEWVLTDFQAGRSLPPKSARTTSLGPSIGLASVNAFSDWLRVETYQQGHVYTQQYRQGRPLGPVEYNRDDPTGRGTAIYFKIDPAIFGPVDHDADLLVAHLQDLCYLVPGLSIRFSDERPGQERIMRCRSTDGIVAWVRQLNRYTYNQVPGQPLYITGRHGDVTIEAALQYSWYGTEQVLTFVNTGRTAAPGPHLRGFLKGLAGGLTQYGRHRELLKPTAPDLGVADIRKGLCAIVSIRLPNPEYANTMSRFTSRGIDKLVEAVVSPAWYAFLEANPQEASELISYRAATTRRKSRDRK